MSGVTGTANCCDSGFSSYCYYWTSLGTQSTKYCSSQSSILELWKLDSNMQCVRSTPAYNWLKAETSIHYLTERKGQMVSDTLIFTPLPFLIPFQITPFLLQASSCSSSSSYFLTHLWWYVYFHPLAHTVLSEPLATSSSISRMSLKNISSVPWNGPYHPHSRNPAESVLETTQSSIEGDGAPDRWQYLDRGH